MKFTEFLTAPFIRSFAIRTGIFIGCGTAILWNWQYGILVGAISVLLISLMLPVLFYFKFLPYKRLKETIEGPFLFDEPVRFTVKKGTVGGFFVLTERSMVFLSRECTTPALELSRDDIKTVSLGQNLTINIYLNNTQFIRVFSGVSEELIEVLREHGWNVAE
ncbi:MAG: hypothetical protein IJX80_01375 [Clostridia bacterium]|nr:hypothetical protein [Clostridia bacterium]